QVSLVVTYLPALILSGFMFPIEGMPLILRIVTHIIPARYYITVTKGIFLKGIGVSILWPQALALVIFATVGLGLGLFAFKKRLA
ncbi:MAG: ABC transporter permease, partial [Gemmatimonadota bacterium]|nr:ABC transporter permease [Gemmatimonadota bacterium]